MNKVIAPVQLPKVTAADLYPPKRGFPYLTQLKQTLEEHINKLTQAHNTATQQVGPPIASDTTIAVSNYMHHVTGTNAISTIKPSPGHSGPIALIADGAFSLTTGGNIAIAGGPYTAGQHVSLVYDDQMGMWFPSA